MKQNMIEAWGLMPPRGHWRSLGWRWEGWICGNATWCRPDMVTSLSASIEADDLKWLHLAVSHRERVPSYDELVEARRAFIDDRVAYQAFVPKAEHFNLYPYCLHLWSPVGHRPLPDFRHGTGGV